MLTSRSSCMSFQKTVASKGDSLLSLSAGLVVKLSKLCFLKLSNSYRNTRKILKNENKYFEIQRMLWMLLEVVISDRYSSINWTNLALTFFVATTFAIHWKQGKNRCILIMNPNPKFQARYRSLQYSFDCLVR